MNNKTLIIAACTFVLGFSAAWLVYPVISQLKSNTSQLLALNAPVSDKKPLDEYSVSEINISEINASETSFPDHLKALIKRDDIEAAVDNFNQLDLGQADNAQLFRVLEKRILGLIEQKRYKLAERWLDQLLAQGFRQVSLHLMKANIREIKGEPLEAIEYLYLAKYFSYTQDEIELAQKEINQFIKRNIHAYKTKQLHKKALVSLLQFATEKQAEHPLFNIELAKLQFEQGESQRALNTLAFIPYSEAYEDEINLLTQLWSIHLSEVAVMDNGIALEKVGSHFIVEVDIGQRATLRLILDTGASISAINEKASQQLLRDGLIEKTDKIIRLNTANGTREVDTYRADSFSVEEFSIEPLILAGIHMKNNKNIDGLLGMDFLSVFKFEIDYERKLLFLKAAP